jgi:hypothetical protein
MTDVFNISNNSYEICQNQLKKDTTYNHWNFENIQRDSRNVNDIDDIKRDLDEVGYSIVNCVSNPNVIYSKVVRDIIDYKMIPNDSVEDVSELLPCHMLTTFSGIVSYTENLTHSESLWTIRCHPEIVNFFANLYNCSAYDLCVSYDTMGIRYAPEIINMLLLHYNIDNSDLLPHIDQAFERPYHDHYQCIYAITDSLTEDDGGLVVFPGTHKLHGIKLQELLKTEPNREFIQYPIEYFELFPNSYPVKLNIKAGDIVLWDSRLLHGSVNISQDRDKDLESLHMYDAFKLNRMVSYICYAKKNEIKKIEMSREEIYNNGYTTNHMVKNPRVIKRSTAIPVNYINEYHSSLVK